MAETSVFWLRVAAAFYSLGLLHAILTLVRRREQIFRVALGASALGAVFHFVSIVEDGLATGSVPSPTSIRRSPCARFSSCCSISSSSGATNCKA